MKTLCVSLDTAKALKAAGWTNPTAFVYEDLGHRQQLRLGAIKMNPGDFYAPTAEEVLRELPDAVFVNGVRWRFNITRNKVFFIDYIASHSDIKINVDFGQTEADKSLSEAAAQMWLWCVSEGHIKVVKP